MTDSRPDSAESAAGYPTRFPVLTYDCNNFKCRVRSFTGSTIHPLLCCPLCQREGSVTSPESRNS